MLGRYYDAIVCRTYKQTTLDMLAKYSGIPVVSGMTDYAQPLQLSLIHISILYQTSKAFPFGGRWPQAG